MKRDPMLRRAAAAGLAFAGGIAQDRSGNRFAKSIRRHHHDDSAAAVVVSAYIDNHQGATSANINPAGAAGCNEAFEPFHRDLQKLELAAATWRRTFPPPNEQAFSDARVLLRRLEAAQFVPTGIMASAEGGIGIYFRVGTRYADFECSNFGRITAFTSDGTGQVCAMLVEANFEDEIKAINDVRAFLEIA
jgi:hypothetical protein